MDIKKKISHIVTKVIYMLLSKTDKNGVSYLWKKHNSDELVIVFSGIGPASFNYVKTLKNCTKDLLFIKDSFSEGVSYYWYERKENYPEIYTQQLIKRIIEWGGYKKVYTAGSSKGGSAALYYGFLNEVDTIIAGACQYYVGNYLAYCQYKVLPEQWENMIGGVPEKEWIEKLNQKIPKVIEAHNNIKTTVYLVYSTKEHTYKDDISPLINQLDSLGISHNDQIEEFPEHSMIGIYFKTSLQRLLC